MIRSIQLSRSALLVGAAAIALAATPALAQSVDQTNADAATQPPAPKATTAADAESKDSATGDIVVTARRTEENVQRVPSSISAFNERSLDRIQATDTTGLQGAVPNLNIVQGRGSSNSTNIFIRGIGQPDALQTFDPAVGVYVDDVYLSRIRGNQLDLLDLERIEVLRGPQGTLYGKNTIAGAIKFVTRRPGQTFRANGSIAVGSYDQIELKGAVSGPLSETVAAGFAVIHATRNGYVGDSANHREYNDKNSNGGRAAIAFTPSSVVRVDITADYSHDNAALNVGRPVNNLTTFSGTVLVVTDPVNSGNRYTWHGRTTPSLPNSTTLRHYGFTGTAAFDVTDALTLKSITAYRNLKTRDYVDIDATQYQVGDVLVNVDQHQVSQEFQAAYTGERLSGVAGLYYLKEDIVSHQEAFANDLLGPAFLNSPFLRTVDDDLTTKSYAAYVNGSYEVVPSVRLSAGLRYTKETKDYFRTTSSFFGLLPFFNATFAFVPPKGKWRDWSPMASVDWQVNPTTMVYARAAKGFKSGGFNGRANTAAEASEYNPESVWSYEAGFKTSVANQLRLNGAIFHSDYKDFQARIGDIDPTAPFPTPLLKVLNVGKMRIRGAELEANWTPVTGLLIDGQLGYLDAKYLQFADDRFPGGSRAFQTPAFAPKWTLRLGAQYAVDIGSAGSITLGGQSRYKSRTALAVDNTVITYANFLSPGVGTTTEVDGLFQKGYWVHDARIVYEAANKHFALGLYGSNLTKKAYKTDAQEFSNIGSIRTVYYGAPRTITLKLTARY
ncbi:TonB-dependent receptor [Sphingomonas sp.]|uniref:TonB-dependent receptor n=1 Tax=Sphingomonas sp. TaxID=28214 RepID=UPI00286BB8E5|nr:TonB-dependent receptor [Sphingomonas sp.]